MGLFGKNKAERLFELERIRVGRRMATEDVAQLGEDLDELDLDDGEDYRQAVDAYERAKQLLRDTADADVFTTLLPVLEHGRFHLACIQARRDGRPSPSRLPSCYFNAQHGPSYTEVVWAPPGDDNPQRVPACLADVNRLETKKSPAVRMVRVGDQVVPWFAADKVLGLHQRDVDVRQLAKLYAENQHLTATYGDAVKRQIRSTSSRRF